MKDVFYYFIRDVTGRSLPVTVEHAAYYLGRCKLPYIYLFSDGIWPISIPPYTSLRVCKKENV